MAGQSAPEDKSLALAGPLTRSEGAHHGASPGTRLLLSKQPPSCCWCSRRSASVHAAGHTAGRLQGPPGPMLGQSLRSFATTPPPSPKRHNNSSKSLWPVSPPRKQRLPGELPSKAEPKHQARAVSPKPELRAPHSADTGVIPLCYRDSRSHVCPPRPGPTPGSRGPGAHLGAGDQAEVTGWLRGKSAFRVWPGPSLALGWQDRRLA